MSQYRAYFVPGAVDPSGETLEHFKPAGTTNECTGCGNFAWKIGHRLKNPIPGRGDDERNIGQPQFVVQKWCSTRVKFSCEKVNGCCQPKLEFPEIRSNCVWEILPIFFTFSPATGDVRHELVGGPDLHRDPETDATGCVGFGYTERRSEIWLVSRANLGAGYTELLNNVKNNRHTRVAFPDGSSALINAEFTRPDRLAGEKPDSIWRGVGTWSCCPQRKALDGGIGFPPPTCTIKDSLDVPQGVDLPPTVGLAGPETPLTDLVDNPRL